MTATNINIEEFIALLVEISKTGIKFIDMDMLPDENNPKMNKLILHPVRANIDPKNDNNQNRIAIINPNISTDNNDIFNAFNDLI